MKRVRSWKTKEKIILYLLSGIGVGLTYNPYIQRKIIKDIPHELEKIEKAYIAKAIRELYSDNLITNKLLKNNIKKIVLTAEGKRRAKLLKLKESSFVRPAGWDRKWRLVIYDIPEKHRKGRDIFRHQLRVIGFYEFQKSVWIYPYDCEDVLDFLIDAYELEEYVNYATVQKIAKEKGILKYFNLK